MNNAALEAAATITPEKPEGLDNFLKEIGL